MRFEYCSVRYNPVTDWGEFVVHPPQFLNGSRGITNVLNALGQEGWELVSSVTKDSHSYLIFKKRIEAQERS